MAKFIAYFDYLGFKSFIENNDIDTQKKAILNNLRDIENAISKGKRVHDKGIADLSKAKINCIHFSDTVIFLSNDDSIDSLREILKVAHLFNWQSIIYFNPVRGAILHEEIEYFANAFHSPIGAKYSVITTYGKGLIDAYKKAESQHWAGTVIDNSVIEKIIKMGVDVKSFLNPFAIKYKVPYKNQIVSEKEYVLSIFESGLNENHYKVLCNDIKNNFSKYNKSTDNEDVQEKIKNTNDFLKAFCRS